MTLAVAPVDDRRSAALLKAIGLDKVPGEQRELALAIADRYGLDLMLKHLVLVDGRPYITRDGLLHIAHRSGQFDGMEVTDPAIVDVGAGKFWSARCSVYRKDMARPFTYAGRYPTSGGNQRFAPEMAVKVSEVMALRRAFDVSAPVLEERWDMDAAPEPEPVRSLDDRIAERSARVTTSAGEVADVPPLPSPAPTADIVEAVAVEVTQCQAMSDGALGEPVQCRRSAGHTGVHKTPDQSWPQ
jgi:hypothetical protein